MTRFAWILSIWVDSLANSSPKRINNESLLDKTVSDEGKKKLILLTKIISLKVICEASKKTNVSSKFKDLNSNQIDFEYFQLDTNKKTLSEF